MVFLLALLLAFSFAESTTYATPNTNTGNTAADEANDDGNMEWGWIGLIGLAGLLGLRSNDDRRII